MDLVKVCNEDPQNCRKCSLIDDFPNRMRKNTEADGEHFGICFVVRKNSYFCLLFLFPIALKIGLMIRYIIMAPVSKPNTWQCTKISQ